MLCSLSCSLLFASLLTARNVYNTKQFISTKALFQFLSPTTSTTQERRIHRHSTENSNARRTSLRQLAFTRLTRRSSARLLCTRCCSAPVSCVNNMKNDDCKEGCSHASLSV